MKSVNWQPTRATAEETGGGTTTETSETKTDASETLYGKEGETKTENAKTEEAKTEEAKIEDTKSDETKSDETKTEETKVEPLTVEALKIPEGTELDEGLTKKFLDVMNNGELSAADRANALLELQADAMKAASEQSSALWESQQKQWQDEVRADPEIGGEKLDQNLANIRKLMDEYGSTELEGVLDVTGAGNNIHFIRFMAKLADMHTEGGPLSGRPAGGMRDPAEILYPSQGG